MKKLIVTILAIATVGMTGTAVADSAPVTDQTNTASSLATETINDIAIPTDVLIYVQTHYQGYAVTQASKTMRDGKQVYSLRVDPNDVTTDYDGFYLLYDSTWKLMGEEKMAPPAPKTDPKPSNSTNQSSTQKHTTKRKHGR